MTFIDDKIQQVVLEPKTRGAIVCVKWNSGNTSQIHFKTKKEAKYYFRWVTGDPKHPIHQNHREITMGVFDDISF